MMGKGSTGIALGPDGLTALVGEGEAMRELHIPLSLPTGPEDPAPAILRALLRLRDAGFGSEGCEVTVALLPPLVEVKLIPLPPLRPEEAEAVLRRDLPKHFLRGSAPSVIGVELGRGRQGGAGRTSKTAQGGAGAAAAPSQPPRGLGGTGTSSPSLPTDTPSPTVPAGTPGLALAAAAPRALAEGILRAVVGAGWRLDGIVPAHSAWLAALREGTAGGGAAGAGVSGSGASGGRAPGVGAPGAAVAASPALLVALLDGTAHLLRLEGNRPTALRRVPVSDGGALLAAGGAGPGRAWIFGEGEEAKGVAAALAGGGWGPGASGRTTGRSAPALAALYAAGAGLELVPPTLAMSRRDRLRRLGVGMGVAAALLLLAAAGVQLWGANRELRLLRAERADLREAVAPVLAAADSLALMEDRLASIAEIEQVAAGWTFALVELAVVLPADVHLSSLRAAGDTLVLQAIGGRAGDALDALRSASSLRDVRLEGAIQRDVEGGAAARERFTLSALRAEGLPPAIRGSGEAGRASAADPGRDP